MNALNILLPVIFEVPSRLEVRLFMCSIINQVLET